MDEVGPDRGVGVEGRARYVDGAVDEGVCALSLDPEDDVSVSSAPSTSVSSVTLCDTGSVIVDPFETPMVALGSRSSTNGLWARALMGFS